MIDSKQWILDHIDIVLFVLIGFMLLILLMFIINTVRLKQVQKRYRTLMKGQKNTNLEDILFQYADNVQHLEAEVRQVLHNQELHQREIERSCGPIGVLRFNAFPDAGSDLSFSIAFLNREADGVVVTSIFGREESRTYAKPIVAGASTYNLSEEEKEAIQKAITAMKS